MDSLPNSPESNVLHPTNIFNVEGMVAVVTGGGTGIGLQIAKSLESNGATVYIVGRRLEVLQKAAEENNVHKNLIPYRTDVTSLPSLQELVAYVKERHGHVDLLVNNAGIVRGFYPKLPGPTDDSARNHTKSPSKSHTPSQPSIKAFQQALWTSSSPQDFAESFATNVTAPYYVTVAFLELLHAGNLRQQQPHSNGTAATNGARAHSQPLPPPVHSSQVITISSSGAFRLDAGVLSPSYTVAKCAATHLGRLLANLLAPWGIRSNVLAPGVWPSEMTMTGSITPSMLASSVPLRRPGTQEDMAGVILFLASRAGSYVNGDVWLVDGGRVAGLPNNYGSWLG